jgi:hypothetical protein
MNESTPDCFPSAESGPNRGMNEERVLGSERRQDPCPRKTQPMNGDDVRNNPWGSV